MFYETSLFFHKKYRTLMSVRYFLCTGAFILGEIVDLHSVFHFSQCLGSGLFRLLRSFFQHVIECGDIFGVCFPARADGSEFFLQDVVQESFDLYVTEAAAPIVCLKFIEAGILFEIERKMLRTAEGIQVSEDRIALHISRVGDFDVSGVGVHGHDFFPYNIGAVGEIDRVAQGFRHFGFAIGPRQTQTGFVRGKQNFRFYQYRRVDVVKFPHDFPRLFQHRFLILTHRNGGGFEGCNISGLTDRVADKAYRHAFTKIFLLNLCFDGGVSFDAGQGN